MSFRVILILTSIFVLSGCGGNGTEEVSTPTSEESSTFGSAEFGSVKFQ